MVTVRATYTDGVFKPSRQIDLPGGTTVELQIATASDTSAKPGASFASLAGIWSHLSDSNLDRFEKALQYTRKKTDDRVTTPS